MQHNSIQKAVGSTSCLRGRYPSPLLWPPGRATLEPIEKAWGVRWACLTLYVTYAQAPCPHRRLRECRGCTLRRLFGTALRRITHGGLGVSRTVCIPILFPDCASSFG